MTAGRFAVGTFKSVLLSKSLRIRVKTVDTNSNMACSACSACISTALSFLRRLKMGDNVRLDNEELTLICSFSETLHCTKYVNLGM